MDFWLFIYWLLGERVGGFIEIQYHLVVQASLERYIPLLCYIHVLRLQACLRMPRDF